LDTLLMVPDDPPAAGPERAFDPPPASRADVVGVEAAVVAVLEVVVPEPLLAVAPPTMPYAPPPITTIVAPMAMGLVSLWENMGLIPPWSVDLDCRLFPGSTQAVSAPLAGPHRFL
jgi:hypothetical protein